MEAQLLGFKKVAISTFLWIALNLIAAPSYSQCSVSISSTDTALVCGETAKLTIESVWQKVNTIPLQRVWCTSFPQKQIGFLGGDSGSIYKTTDGGANFTPLNTPNSNIGIRTIWFFNSQSGIVFTDSGQIYKTGNNGANWTNISYPLTVPDSAYTWTRRLFFSSHFTSNNVGFVGGSIISPSGPQKGILYKTTNGGTNWAPVILPSINRIEKVYFLDSLTGFICAHGDLLKTTNGGNSWISVYSNPSLYFYDVTFINKDTGFVASNGLIRTIDGGITWTPLNSPYGSFGGINKDYSNRVYFYSGSNLYRSVDFGNSWAKQPIDPPLTQYAQSIRDLSFAHGHPGLAIGIESFPNKGFVLKLDKIDSVLWVRDNGLIDTLSKNPLVTPNLSTTYFATAWMGNCSANGNITILVDPLDIKLKATQVMSCEDSILLLPETNLTQSNAYNFQWQPNLFLSNSQIDKPIAKIKTNTQYKLVVNSNNGCSDSAYTQINLNFNTKASSDFTLKCGDEKMLKLLPSGWSKASIDILPLITPPFTDLVAPNQDSIYLIGGRKIWRSDKYGKVWQPVYNVGGINNGFLVKKGYFRNGRLGFATGADTIGSQGVILKTSNAGETWQSVNVGNYQLNGIFFTSDQIGYAIANPGKILKTTNAGSTWFPINSGVTNYLIDIYFPNSLTGYAVGNDGIIGIILKTTNSGSNWVNLNAPFKRDIKTLFFTSVDTGFVGSIDTVWKTTNGGSSWTPFVIKSNSTTTFVINDIHFISSQHGYMAAEYNSIYGPLSTYGAIFETKNAGLTWERAIADSTNGIKVIHANLFGFGLGIGGNNHFIYKDIEAQNYQWEPITGLNNFNVKEPLARPIVSTSYTVTASRGECYIKDSINVNVKPFMQPATQNHEIVCGDSFNFINPNVHLYIDGSRQGLSNWEILNQQNNVVMKSTYDKVEFGNYYFSPGNYTFKWRPTGPAMHQIIKIIPIIGDSISEEFFYTLDTLKVRNFTVGSTQNYTYNWFPKQTLVGPNTPVVKYGLTITAPNGCQGNDSISISPKAFKVKLNGYTYGAVYGPLGCGSEVQLDSTLSNYTGKGKLNFKWADPKLVKDTNSFLPKLSPVKSGFISMQAYTPNGCQASDSVQFIVEPLFVRIMDTSVSCKTSFKPSIFTNYNGSKPLIGNWIPTIDLDSANNMRPTITPTSNRTYVVNFSSNIGCAAKDTFKVNLMQGKGPSICLVGVDEQNKNRIIWNKTEALNTDRFFLYKESNITNQYNQFAEVMPTQDFIYIDSNSSPLVQSSKYLLQRLDVCGITSNFGTPHKTMHLTINKGSGNTWNLIWNTYEGFTVSTYNIYRGTNASDLKQIGTSSGSNNTYTDLTAPAGDVYYQVELISPNNCSPSKTYNTSKSNIMSNKFLSMAEPTLGLNFSMYPNPTQNQLSIVMENMNEPCTATLFSMDGKTLLSQILNEPSSEIYLGQFAAGMYLIEIKNSKGKAHQFVVKE